MNFLKNKIGDWNVQEFAKILLAVVGILMMIPIFVLLINLFSEDEESNSKRFVDSLAGKIDNLKVGEVGKFPIQGMKGWILTGWGRHDSNRIDKCFFDSCICICRAGKDKCQEEGFCRKIKEEEISLNSSLKTIHSKYFKIPNRGGFFNLIANCIVLRDSLLMEIEVIKSKDSVSISTVYSSRYSRDEMGSIAKILSQCPKFVEIGTSYTPPNIPWNIAPTPTSPIPIGPKF